MVARRILRFPRRSATTMAGIAMAMGLMVTTQHFPLAMNRIIEVTFGARAARGRDGEFLRGQRRPHPARPGAPARA